MEEAPSELDGVVLTESAELAALKEELAAVKEELRLARGWRTAVPKPRRAGSTMTVLGRTDEVRI